MEYYIALENPVFSGSILFAISLHNFFTLLSHSDINTAAGLSLKLLTTFRCPEVYSINTGVIIFSNKLIISYIKDAPLPTPCDVLVIPKFMFCISYL